MVILKFSFKMLNVKKMCALIFLLDVIFELNILEKDMKENKMNTNSTFVRT